AAPTTPISVDEKAAAEQTLIREPGNYPGSLQTVKIDARVASVRPMPSTAEAKTDDSARAEGGMMPAALCPSGHVNPPGRPRCRICGAHVGTELVEVEAPILGRVVAPGGRSVPLLGTVLIGRSPSGSAGETTLAIP